MRVENGRVPVFSFRPRILARPTSSAFAPVRSGQTRISRRSGEGWLLSLPPPASNKCTLGEAGERSPSYSRGGGSSG